MPLELGHDERVQHPHGEAAPALLPRQSCGRVHVELSAVRADIERRLQPSGRRQQAGHEILREPEVDEDLGVPRCRVGHRRGRRHEGAAAGARIRKRERLQIPNLVKPGVRDRRDRTHVVDP